MSEAALVTHDRASNFGTFPARLATANNVCTLAILALVVAVVIGLSLGFGRTGERIATQMCVNLAAVVALGVYCGNTGIVSFGHGAFMLLGAYLSGILSMPAMLQSSALPDLPAVLAAHELSIWAGLSVVMIAGFLFAAVTGLAIARLRSASATIATLGLLIIVHNVAVGARELTRGSQTFFGVPRTTDLFFALSAAILFIIIARLYRESRYGLFARASRDDPDAASALGIKPEKTRFISWCLSGTMMTLAGAFYGHMLGAFSPASFYLSLMFAHVAMLIVGGMASVGGAVGGVMVVTLLQDSVRQFEGGGMVLGVELPRIFGLATVALGLAILLIIRFRPQGLVGKFEFGPDANLLGFHRIFHDTQPAQAPSKTPAVSLSAEHLSKSFAGVQAVCDVSFSTPSARVTGLIGPNGAGKSTVVNLLTRQYLADAGSVKFGHCELTSMSPEQIGKIGVARSFQNLRMFDGLTAYENVLVGALASGAGWRQSAEISIRELSDFDLKAVAHMHAGDLSYGAQKRLEIARALAQEPAILLLDEPAAGMNPSETENLANRLEQMAQTRGIGMLLIDHDLRFVNRLSEWIVVMNRGQLIAQGIPEEIRANPKVIEAYIGKGRTAASANYE